MAWLNLFEHQLNAIEKMSNGCILNGGVGSGKSITALAYYYLRNGGRLPKSNDDFYPMDDPPKRLYIITTAKKRDSLEWDNEMVRFLLSRDKKHTIYSKTVVVDSWNNIKKYANVSNSFFIFDEQRVVGKGAWVSSFIKIAKNNEWILLSATPGDSWQDYIPVFIANGFFKNRTEFNSEHVVFSPYVSFPLVDRYINTGRLIRLRNRILVDMDFNRHTVRHESLVKVDYDVAKYKEILKTRWNPWEDKPIESPGEFIYCLRKVVNTDESRQQKILEIADKNPKIIIFYNFDYELDLLKSLSYSDGAVISEWNGHKHQPIPESDKWVYLVQYNAGCEGWNCVSTNTIIFYSRNHSYKMTEQAMGRIDRINTSYIDLYYYHISSNASVDLAINRALTKKKEFNFNRWAVKIYGGNK